MTWLANEKRWRDVASLYCKAKAKGIRTLGESRANEATAIEGEERICWANGKEKTRTWGMNGERKWEDWVSIEE